MLIYSAIILHALPAAMLYRPPSFYRRRKAKVSKQDSENHKDGEDANKNLIKQLPEEEEVEQPQQTNEQNNESSKTFLIEDNKDLKLTVGISKSKQSLYASTSSLYFAPHQDITADPDPPSQVKQSKPSCGFCRIFEWSHFRNWLFVIYVLGLSCGHGGYINLCMFFPPYAAEQGIDKEKVALLMSIIGVSDLVGRILGGWFADLGLMKRSNIMAVCLSFTGTTQHYNRVVMYIRQKKWLKFHI